MNGCRTYVGSRAYLEQNGIDLHPLDARADEFAGAGEAVLWIAVASQLTGLIVVQDQLKTGSADAISNLKTLGVEVVMLTGDSESTAAAVAEQAGVTAVRAALLPADKAKAIEALRSRGRIVAMVGDGINDAPSLAAADVGIAMATGTDIALAASDVTVMRSDLGSVHRAIRLGRAAIRIMHEISSGRFFTMPLVYPWRPASCTRITGYF